jgi:hypothetical protein
LNIAYRSSASSAAGVNGADFFLIPGDGGAVADRSGRYGISTRVNGAAGNNFCLFTDGGATVGGRIGLGEAVPTVMRSTVDVFGSFGIGAIRSIADAAFPATQLDSDYLILANSTGLGRVLNLVSTTGRQGRHVVIRKAQGAAASVVITPAGGDTVDGAATLTITGNPANQAVILMANDVNNDWVVLATRN